MKEEINKIITSDILEISQQTKTDIQNTIEIAKKTKEIRDKQLLKKQHLKSDAAEKTKLKLSEIYDELVKRGIKGMATSELLVMGSGISPTLSGLVLKLKAFADKNKGNEYVISRQNGRYFCIEFNKPSDQ